MADFIEQKRDEADLFDGDIDFSTEPGLGDGGFWMNIFWASEKGGGNWGTRGFPGVS